MSADTTVRSTTTKGINMDVEAKFDGSRAGVELIFALALHGWLSPQNIKDLLGDEAQDPVYEAFMLGLIKRNPESGYISLAKHPVVKFDLDTWRKHHYRSNTEQEN